LTPIAAGFLRWNAMSDQADRQRHLNVAVPALVAIDEMPEEERNVAALLQIAALPQQLSDVGGNVLRPLLGGVESNHADLLRCHLLIVPASRGDLRGFQDSLMIMARARWRGIATGEDDGGARKGAVKKRTRKSPLQGRRTLRN
jgi:hypothetical protein